MFHCYLSLILLKILKCEAICAIIHYETQCVRVRSIRKERTRRTRRGDSTVSGQGYYIWQFITYNKKYFNKLSFEEKTLKNIEKHNNKIN